jgi:hypothetical protein
MLAALQGRGSDRQFRLFSCACCRGIWDRLPDPANRDLVAAIEECPGGTFRDLEAVLVASSARECEVGHEPGYRAAKYLGLGFSKMSTAQAVLMVCDMVVRLAQGAAEVQAELNQQAAILRDIFGDPFRPAPLEPSWRTPLVVGLARAAYDERDLPAGTLDPLHLGVLADAAEEAGCEDAELLGHLRGPGPHWRGCWAIDLVLGLG